MQLTKHHALGNDFLVCLPLRGEAVPSRLGEVEAARALCDRRRGVGADGLIWGTPLPAGGSTAGAPVAGEPTWEMLLLNADGSEAEISGNGVRCLAQAIWRQAGGRDDGKELLIATGGGVRRLVRHGSITPVVDDVSVDMGPVSAGPDLDGVTPLLAPLGPRHLAAARIGNPHVVAHVEDGAGVALGEIGPAVEAAVPGGVNLHLLEVIDDHTIVLRHWERGAGLTDACGSGASVSAHLARLWGLTGPEVKVRMPGGEAVVTAGPTVELRSHVSYVATVEVP